MLSVAMLSVIMLNVVAPSLCANYELNCFIRLFRRKIEKVFFSNLIMCTHEKSDHISICIIKQKLLKKVKKKKKIGNEKK
jgi:hypothetical protein